MHVLRQPGLCQWLELQDIGNRSQGPGPRLHRNGGPGYTARQSEVAHKGRSRHKLQEFSSGQFLRNDQLNEITKFTSKITTPIFLLGDLNLTPWSPYFGRFLKETKLHNSARGRGLQPTWPTYFYPLRIPIDHCLYSPEISVIKRQVCSDIGSDHLPLYVEFGLLN